MALTMIKMQQIHQFCKCSVLSSPVKSVLNASRIFNIFVALLSLQAVPEMTAALDK